MLNSNEHLIGKRIKDIRKAKNLTQRQIADLTDISETVISQYENSVKTPGLTNLAKISQALEVSLDELYYGDKNERFINEAVDEAELIVNCYYELWEHRAINLYNYLFDFKIDNYGVLFARDYSFEIEDYIKQLNNFKANESSYENPADFVKSIKSSIANRIRKENM